MSDDDGARLEKARGWALAYLNRRERSVAEVRAHLRRKDVSESTTEAVLEELIADRLVDDARFAEMFVADKRGLEQWGAQRIRTGLIGRGVDREVAEAALAAADRADAEAADAGGWPLSIDGGAGADLPSGELGRALALLRRRFPDPPRERRDRDRALGVLVRRGYESELALDAIAAHARGD